MAEEDDVDVDYGDANWKLPVHPEVPPNRWAIGNSTHDFHLFTFLKLHELRCKRKLKEIQYAISYYRNEKDTAHVSYMEEIEEIHRSADSIQKRDYSTLIER
jgi:hypothetical protein